MRRPTLKDLRSVNESLRSEAFATYRRVLLAVCSPEVCAAYPEVEKFRTLVSFHDWRAAYDLAESMSKQQYSTPHMHYVWAQLSALIKKYPFKPELLGFDPEATAYAKFAKSEHKCKWMNRKFQLIRNYRSPRESELSVMRAYIAYVLGPLKLQDVYAACDFGPGASLGVNGSATHVGRKLHALRTEFTVTPSCLKHLRRALGNNDTYLLALCEHREYSWGRVACIGSSDAKAKLVKHNKVSFVPKTAKTYRSIAVEPLGNGFIQKGIDVLMRRKLLRVGLDLTDQSRNAELARQGSFDQDDGFCTIDLSSASDSIARELVRYLLPSDWYSLLDETRSLQFEYRDQVTGYAKFCSMGNGFCFPLQTLIFASVCIACGAKGGGVDFSVYGDDIIVRKSIFAKVVSLLKYCGFTPNADKTFATGPFRESCGSDWYTGIDVRPYTLDEELDCVTNIFKALNLMRRNSLSQEFLRPAIEVLIDELPARFRFYRPHKGPADSGIDPVGLEYLVSPLVTWNKHLQCYRWMELQHTAITDGDERWLDESLQLAGVLRNGDSKFQFRRKTRIRMRSVSYG